MHSRRSVLTTKCPYGEVSVWPSVRTAKCPYGQVFVPRNVRRAKFPTVKCPTAKFPTAKSLGAVRIHRQIKIYYLFDMTLHQLLHKKKKTELNYRRVFKFILKACIKCVK